LKAVVPSWLPSERTLVDDGDLLTAAGTDAWKYLSLRLLARVYGHSVMSSVSQQLQLVIPRTVQDDLERFSPNFAHGDRCILKAQRWLHGIAARGVSLQDICDSAGLEPRTLQGRSTKSPATWATQTRAPSDGCSCASSGRHRRAIGVRSSASVASVPRQLRCARWRACVRHDVRRCGLIAAVHAGTMREGPIPKAKR